MKVDESTQGRRLLLRADPGETLPGTLARALRDERVRCGWLRGQGVLVDVELRGFAGRVAGLVDARRVPGPLRIVTLEGSVASEGKEPSIGLHALLARDGDRGIELYAGEILSARVVVLEAVVDAFDDVGIRRELDRDTGVWSFGASTAGEPTERLGGRTGWQEVGSVPAAMPTATVTPTATATPTTAIPSATATPARTASAVASDPWAAVAEASEREEVRAAREDEEDEPTPQGGDTVFHFAFGRCDVIRGDGDRLRLKIHKDGRVREVALEMLQVKLMDQEGKRRTFRLDRKG